jgi:hypothetical protein
MSELDERLAAVRDAVEEMIRTSAESSATWSTPRAPGKWSPSLVVEHVALALEASADDIAGRPSRLPNLPRPLRPVARTLLFNRVLRSRAFPKAKTNRAMDPLAGPATPDDAATRLEDAWRALCESCAAAASREEMTSTVFGCVRLVDYVRFQEYHTRHHHTQMTWRS